MAVPGPPLVTGGTGFAGRHLIAHLLDGEPEIAAWGNPQGQPLPGDGDGRVRWSAVDVLDMTAMLRELDAVRPSAIYHCAGIADVHAAWSDTARPLRVNALGTARLLEAVRLARLDAPVLVTGSALVYRPSPEPLTEDSPLGPSNPYGISKLAQEMVAARTDWCRVLLARPFNHAGPGQSSSYVTSSFARQIAEIEAGLREPVLHVGNLEARRDITDVRDTVRAYRLLVNRGRHARPYNVCSGRACRVGDLVELLTAKARTPIRVDVDPDRLRPSDNPIVVGSYARIEAETGWRPGIPIERTLGDLLDHWRRALTARGPA
jgi:GDP-4-dehydro-6-deoxy-D-mannose reductase